MTPAPARCWLIYVTGSPISYGPSGFCNTAFGEEFLTTALAAAGRALRIRQSQHFGRGKRQLRGLRETLLAVACRSAK